MSITLTFLAFPSASHAVNWDHRGEHVGTVSASTCRESYMYFGDLNFVRWEDGYPYQICMVNGDENLQDDRDLRALDFFLDDYYVGMNSSTSIVNTRYMKSWHTTTFLVFNATSCTGSQHTMLYGDTWTTSGFKVTSVKRNGDTTC